MLMEISMRLRQEATKMGYEFRFGVEIYQEDGIEYLVEMEPETFDVCNHELTDYSKEAVLLTQYGSNMVDFIKENLPVTHRVVINSLKKLNGIVIVPVSSIIDEINNLKPEAPEGEECLGLHVDRVKWFQYWANKCIRLYSDAVKFSVS